MASNNQYQALNDFQKAFYTDINKFADYSKHEVKTHGYVLLNNLAKGFPNLADLITNLKGFNWKGPESPAILQALQQFKFVTPMKKSQYVPKFVYFKTPKKTKTKSKARKTKNGLLEFDKDIVTEICSILMYDSKTFENLKFSDTVQSLGKELTGEVAQQDKLRKRRKTK